jgi:hypothetical protein
MGGEGSSSWRPLLDLVEVHTDDGDYEDSKVFAYVDLERDLHNLFPFIREAMERRCSAPAFRFTAASRGVGVMVFDSVAEREHVVGMSPIHYDDNVIKLVRHEEAENRFVEDYCLYAEVAVRTSRSSIGSRTGQCRS